MTFWEWMLFIAVIELAVQRIRHLVWYEFDNNIRRNGNLYIDLKNRIEQVRR